MGDGREQSKEEGIGCVVLAGFDANIVSFWFLILRDRNQVVVDGVSAVAVFLLVAVASWCCFEAIAIVSGCGRCVVVAAHGRNSQVGRTGAIYLALRLSPIDEF